ncbi:FtsX-like permease family protein [Streptomyces litchfieldiae]|uniref:FtsX-like permease family protein n=1 Tax=Streptomyces litchfieldiae TaxID=3075543 RepID=A0ABU2MLZ1_9ACTN|nr:FtsX-like permease family protein [Streptomyces sp. DSM 44938]MDT0342388.1 FtsX-like permease family protein [Streptomyces sp. DSM 44938]
MRNATLGAWARELAIGARFAVTGGPGWIRTVLTAAGVGLGVVVLLLAASVPNVMDERDRRGDARSPGFASGVTAGPDTILFTGGATEYRGQEVDGLLIQPDAGADTTAEPPPGVEAFPGPGEMVVSPALAELLDSPKGELLAERLDYRRVGVIGDEGLAGPGELYYYAGTDSLGDEAPRTQGFGASFPDSPLPSALVLLIVVLCVVLLMPIAVFVATAVRFGGERRDRRLAALRLVGADTDMTRRVAAGEALVGAVGGLLVGVAGFLMLRQLLGGVTAWGFSAFTADIVPAAPLAALVLAGVPVAAVAVSLFALRGIAIEPLGVVRESTARPRKLGWRLVPVALGVLLLLPMIGSFEGSSRTGETQAAVGVVLLLAGATVLLPWLVESVVGRLGGGPASWQLATRRLQLSSGAAARTVSGITVAVAGATALYMLFAGARSEQTEATGEDVSRVQLAVNSYGLGREETEELFGRLESVPGVTGVFGLVDGSYTKAGQPAGGEFVPTGEIVVGDCAALNEVAHLEGCADGDVFLAADPDSADSADLPEPGQQLDLGVDSEGRRVTDEPELWTVPATASAVESRVDPSGGTRVGVLATPAALDTDLIPDPWSQAWLTVDPAAEDTIEHVRNVAWREDSPPAVWEFESERVSDELLDIQRALLIGSTGVLTIIAASMIVSMLEQLRERRRLLSALVAFGTRRTTLGASVLWQTAVPMVLGLTLAAAVGTGLGAILMAMVGLPVTGWLAFLPMTGVGAGMIAVVTLVSLPPLWRMMRPDGLRTE